MDTTGFLKRGRETKIKEKAISKIEISQYCEKYMKRKENAYLSNIENIINIVGICKNKRRCYVCTEERRERNYTISINLLS